MRVRAGLLLWVLSWVPFVALFGLRGWMVPFVWTTQVIAGLVGLAVAGTAVASEVKAAGITHTPRIVWSQFRYGGAAAAPHGDTPQPSV